MRESKLQIGKRLRFGVFAEVVSVLAVCGTVISVIFFSFVFRENGLNYTEIASFSDILRDGMSLLTSTGLALILVALPITILLITVSALYILFRSLSAGVRFRIFMSRALFNGLLLICLYLSSILSLNLFFTYFYGKDLNIGGMSNEGSIISNSAMVLAAILFFVPTVMIEEKRIIRIGFRFVNKHISLNLLIAASSLISMLIILSIERNKFYWDRKSEYVHKIVGISENDTSDICKNSFPKYKVSGEMVHFSSLIWLGESKIIVRCRDYLILGHRPISVGYRLVLVVNPELAIFNIGGRTIGNQNMITSTPGGPTEPNPPTRGKDPTAPNSSSHARDGGTPPKPN